MKKVLLSLFVLGAAYVGAQTTFGFETSEGFTLGDVTGQNGWSATYLEGILLEGQHVTNEEAASGDHSLKLAFMEDYGYLGQDYGYVLGAYYFYPEVQPLATGYTIQWDFLGTAIDGSDFVLKMIGSADGGESMYSTIWHDFSYTGDVKAVVLDPSNPGYLMFADTTGTWAGNVWYNSKVVYNGAQFEFYLDDVLIGSYDPITAYDQYYFMFVTDNYAFDGYVDNVTFGTNLAVSDVALNNSVSAVYPNPARDVVNIKLAEGFDANKTKVTVTNVSGQQVATFGSASNVNVAKLPAGVYVLTITDGVKTETKKLIKK